MLAGAGFGNDAFRAERACQQRLADRVVDLVCAGMGEILALEPDIGAPARPAPASVPSVDPPRSAVHA
jgi:hypothetical protein